MRPAAGDRLAASVGSLRRYTWWNFAAFVALAALLPLGPSLTGDLAGWRLPVLLVLLAGGTTQHARLLRDAVAHPGRGVRLPWWAAAGALTALAAVALASDLMPIWALPAAGLAGALAAARPPGSRWPVVAGGAVLTAGCAATGAAVSGPADPLVAGGWALAVVLAIGLAELAQIWTWELGLRLDEARQTEADLAVARERLRFAADLHDLQGQHLQVIALKAELASRLAGTDAETTRAETDHIAEIARTALAETREVVSGYRQASLDTELGNAVGILRAAGIETEVHGHADDVPTGVAPLFGALVREGTTNVLRHSAARHATVWLAANSVRVCNDGAGPTADGAGSGIAGLRDRFAAAGGTVRAGPAGEGTFELLGTA